MPRRKKTTLTFALTLEVPPHCKIPDVRAFIKAALEAGVEAYDEPIKSIKASELKLNLLNKETQYA